MYLKWLRISRIAVVWIAVVTVVGAAGCGSGSTGAPTPAPGPAPTLSAIAPNSAPAGALAFTLTVQGANFVPASVVEWEGSSRTTTFVSSSQLQAHIMAADLATAGKVPVTVVNPAPGGGSSNAVTFTIPADTIAFQSRRALDGSDAASTNSTFNLWVMNADGSGAAPLTKLTLADSFFPIWSPDGSKIVFESARALDGSNAANTNFTFNIWVVSADGSGATPLTKLTVAGGDSFLPIWSPDGSKIVFVSARALDGSNASSGAFNIWVVNADGSGAAPLTKLTVAGGDSTFPIWSPDGSKIVFESARALDGSDAANTNFTPNIWVVNAGGSGATPLTKLTAGGGDSVNPIWSPDGGKIVFSSARALDGSNAANTNSTGNIWVVNADGSGAAPLTKLTAFNSGSGLPKWSPDGSKIVFESIRALDGSNASSGAFNIWVVNADGSGPTPLTKLTVAGGSSFDPIWSPDGSKIVFQSGRALDGSNAANTNVTSNVWVVNADGSAATPLTKLTAATADSGSPNQP